ncbi:complex proteins associated with Set1p component shg1-domain-containing protein [Dichotomocladium elegans]|nr:complex proteins associated with Set1p component shg1-domain-containing protein [Dichotomocladium elegans]
MKADDVVMQLKRNGTFDQLRKHLLTEFQNESEGQAFLAKINSFMEEMINANPSLLEKDRSAFIGHVMKELEKANVYQTVHEQVLGMSLQRKYYQEQINEQIQQVLPNNDTDPGKPETS